MEPTFGLGQPNDAYAQPLKGFMLVYVLMVSFHFDIIIEQHKFNYDLWK